MSMNRVGQWHLPTTHRVSDSLIVESFGEEVSDATDRAFEVTDNVHSVEFVIANVPISVSATDSNLLAAFTGALSHHGIPATRIEAHRPPSAKVRIWSSKSTGIDRPKMPGAIRQRVIARRADLAPGADYQMDFDPTGRMLTMMNPRSGNVDVCLADIANLPQWERAAPLRSALGWILRSNDQHLIHAAAVSSPHGAALLLGAGGAGKSTTSLICRQQGLGFIGDDICVIASDSPPRVFNLYGSAKTVWSDHGRFPDLNHYLVTDPSVGEYKAVYAINKIPDHQIVDSSELRILILLDRTLPVGVAEPVASARVVALVASTTASFLPGSGRPMLNALSGIARRLPVIRLSVGQDPVQVTNLISSAIENEPAIMSDTRAY